MVAMTMRSLGAGRALPGKISGTDRAPAFFRKPRRVVPGEPRLGFMVLSSERNEHTVPHFASTL
jgi:hypothetical protein